MPTTETQEPPYPSYTQDVQDVIPAASNGSMDVLHTEVTRAPATVPLKGLPQDRWLLLAAITMLAGVTGAAYYLGFVHPYLLEANYTRPLMDLAKLNGHTPASANAWAFTWVVAFACYYLAFRLCPSFRNVSRSFRWVGISIVVGWALLFCVQLVFMYPVGAADIFDQIFRARITYHYGLNPFTTVPNSILGDTFIKFVAWRDDGSPYGPLWELLTAGTGSLAGDSLWANLLLFKVLVLIPYTVSVGLTYAILRRLNPDWAMRGTLFFAWNPLLLFEIAGNGHNDAFVVMFLLAAVYMFVLARNTAVLPALMAGALTKFIPILLVPVAAAAIWRDRSRRGDRTAGSSFLEPLRTLWLGGIISVAMAVLLYIPFWDGPKSIGALGRQTLFTASLPKVLADWLAQTDLIRSGIHEIDPGRFDNAAQTSAESLVRNGALALVAMVVLAFSLRIFFSRNADTEEGRHELVSRTLRAFYEVMFVYLAFATLWFQPWYLMWLIALTAPLASYKYAHRTLLFCISGVLNYFVWDYLWLWNRAPNREIQVTSALVVYTLPLAYTLYAWLRPLWQRRADTPPTGEAESVRASTAAFT